MVTTSVSVRFILAVGAAVAAGSVFPTELEPGHEVDERPPDRWVAKPAATQGAGQQCFPEVQEGSARLYDSESGASEWFGGIRGGVIAGDGTWVIADWRRRYLHFIGPEGSHRLVGGEGEGPGEFRSVTRLWLHSPDTVAAYDFSTARVTLFDSSGALIDSRLGPANQPLMRVVANVPGVGILYRRNLTGHGAMGVGFFRDSVEYVVSDAEEEVVAFGPFPTTDRYLEGFPLAPVPFGLRLTIRLLGGGQFLVAPGKEPRFEILDLEAGTTRTIQLPLEARTVDGEAVQAVEGAVEAPYAPDVVEAFLTEGPRTEVAPVYSDAHIDRDGWIWVQEFPFPGEPATYLILDQEGRELQQRLVLPSSAPNDPSPLLDADGSTALFRAEDEVGTPLLLVLDRRCPGG